MSSWEFRGNVPCSACEGANATDSAQWHFGDRCLACDDAARNAALSSAQVAWWGMAERGTCVKCDG